jgi:predicted TIM-barrel fold metal-dependent hydrolase
MDCTAHTRESGHPVSFHATKGKEIMLTKPNCPVIALEEHYWDAELTKHYTGPDVGREGEATKRLYDLGELRLKEMDEAGVDIQVLSHGAPSTQKLEKDVAAALTKQVNDRLHATIQANPKRFAGFAALPTADPAAAADELERCVTKLGFKGAMLHGLANGLFLDDKRFWPIYERAEKLDVPIYLHPGLPDARVTDAYYKDYARDFPQLLRAGWGYTVETATLAIRMVLSGVFDKYPKLAFILGHFGETLPFLVWRVDMAMARPGAAREAGFRDVFCSHFHVTTSGFFSDPALLCCGMELGIDRILFAIDWPFVMNPPGVRWLESVPLSDADKAKIASGNARRLLRM